MLFENNAIPHCILYMSSPNFLLGEMQHCLKGEGRGEGVLDFLEKLLKSGETPKKVYCCTTIANINTQIVELSILE